MRPPAWLIVVLVGAALGLVFAGVSTYDFVQHLDRQVHTLHCSFIPGMGHGTGESGCQVAMMSPYSSVFRTKVWGGVPISLPAMAVFAFILCYSVDLLLSKRKDDPRSTGFLALACVLPAAMSLLMGTISLTKLGTACKLCIGIYIASALCLTGAIVTWRRAVKGEQPSQPMVSHGFLAGAFGIGVLFVLVPVLLYFSAAPDHSKFIGTCDGLAKPDDTYGVMVRVGHPSTGGAPTIELLDPLCPACKAFEQRLGASGLEDKLDRKAILFPLDSTCNWMITETTHPGACTVSEAVLCAGDKAPDVIAWAFENGERIRNETKADPTAAAREVKARFPELASCVGSPEAKARVNKSLRWAVANNIRVLTPQLYIDNVKLCDEDVDLGLEYALTIMLDRHAQGTLAKSAPAPAAPTPPITAKPVDDKPADKPAPKADDKSKADDRPKADDKSKADDKQPADKPADKPADQPADKPAEPMPKEEPEKPADKPADKPAEGPVTNPSQVGSQGGAP